VIEVRCCHSLAHVVPFRSAIDELNLASARPDPFSTFAYYDLFLRVEPGSPEGRPQRLWFLLALDGERLAGYLPLKQRTERVLGLRASKLDLLTAHFADRPHLVARPEDVAAVSAAIQAYLLARKKEWSLLEFQQQEADSPLLAAWTAETARDCRVRRWPNMECGTIPIRWNSLGAYFGALSKKSRSNVSRQFRSLLAAGNVNLVTATDAPACALLLELYQGVVARSWKARTTGGFEQHPTWARYYGGLTAADQPMRLIVQLLLLDGIPLAGLLSGAFDGGLYALHIAYDERYARLAPGSAILLMGMRLAIEGKFTSFNLLRGSGYYKTRWLARMSGTQSVQIYRTGTPFFWRRRLGDLRRSCFGESASLDGGPPRDEERRSGARGPIPTSGVCDESARYAGLVEQVRRAPVELLSAAQLSALLPFATRRASSSPAAPWMTAADGTEPRPRW
jgi:CelD/BcsL family acetyltransferase involved in cellulose biosynthesis